MIRLVKNELIKIFHKKGLYILGIVIILIAILGVFVSLYLNDELLSEFDSSYYDYLKENIDSYDLNDVEQLKSFVEDSIELDTYNLLSKYDSQSPEYYYIDVEGRNIISNYYNVRYIDKDQDEIDNAKKMYDDFVNSLKDYDWRNDVEEKLDVEIANKNKIEEELKNEKDDNIILNLKNELKISEIQIEGYEYRLDNNIPLDYSNRSNLVDDYVNSAIEYMNFDSDEDSYKTRDELQFKRDLEEKLYVSKYKLDNKIFDSMNNNTQSNIVSMFSNYDIFILIAIILVVGGIVSEEFNKGTIKQLLVRPHSRIKILTSKLVAGLIAVFIFAIFYYIINFLQSWIVYGEVSSLLNPVVVYDFGKSTVIEISTFYYCFLNIISLLPMYLIIFMVVIFMGIVTLNTASAIITGFGLYVGGDLINMLLPEKIVAYLPTSCWNFKPYLFGGIANNQYSSFSLSLIVCFITLVFLMFFSFYIFDKRDIKNQ